MGAGASKEIFKDKILELAQGGENLVLLEEILNFPTSPEDYFHFLKNETIQLLLKPWLVQAVVKMLLASSNTSQQGLLGAVRLLTRILPPMFDQESLEEQLFWTIPDDQLSKHPSERQLSLGQQLVNAMASLLFCHGFTLPQEIDETAFPIWFCFLMVGIPALVPQEALVMFRVI
jgi:hypothetical protein